MVMTQKTIRTMGFVMVASFASKVLGFLRTILQAGEFGTGIEASAFSIAFRIPDLLFQSIGIALSTVFIPIITEYLSRQDEEGASQFTSNILTLLLTLSAAAAAAGILFAPGIIQLQAGGAPPEVRQLAVQLLRILFPVLVFMTLTFTAVGFLQSHGQFNVPAAISILSNAVVIVYLLFFSKSFGIYGLAAATLLGWALQFAVQAPFLYKTGFHYAFTFSLNHPGIRKFTALVAPVLLGTSVQSLNTFVNMYFASSLHNGQAAPAIDYANQLYIVIVGVVTLTISQIMFQSLSRLHNSGDEEGFRTAFNQSLRLILFVLFPIMAGLISLHNPIITILYERGSFNRTSTTLTGTALLFYSLGTVSFGIQELANRTFFSMQNTKTPAIFSGISMGVNIFLSFILVKLMGIGGLALSASLSSILLSLILLNKLHTIKEGLIKKELVYSFIKIGLCAIPTGVISYLIYEYIITVQGMSGLAGNIMSTALAAAGGGVVYLGCCYILKVEEIKTLLSAIGGRK